MKVQQLNSEASQEIPVIRSHSPYCEAKGPIVKKGFVAAQIRALQDAYSRACVPPQSHSPTIPCPINQRLKKYESYSSLPMPRNFSEAHRRPFNLSTESFANGVSKQIRNDYSLRNILSGRTSRSSNNAGSQTSQGTRVTENPKSIQLKHFKRENKRVSRSNLSSSFDRWTDVQMPSPKPMMSDTQPIFGGSSNGPSVDIVSEAAINSTLSRDHEQIPSARLSIAEELEKYNPPLEVNSSNDHISRSILGLARRPLDESPYTGLSPGTDLSLGSTAKKDTVSPPPSTKNDRSKSLENGGERKKFQVRRKCKRQKTEAPTTNETEENEEAIEKISTSPKRVQRVWTFQHPQRSKSNIVYSTNLRSLSASNRNGDGNAYDLAQASPLELDKHQNSAVRSKSKYQSTVQTPNLCECRQSGIPPEKAPRRWSWWRWVSVDKKPTASIASTNIPSSAASIHCEYQQADEIPSHEPGFRDDQNLRTQDSSNMNTVAGCGHDDEIEDVRDTVETISEHENDHSSRIKLALRTSYTRSTSSFTEPILGIPKARAQAEKLSEWIATLPVEEPMHAPSPALPSTLRTNSSSDRTEGRCRSKGKRITRVQVIVSLDGAADVVVEARLQRRSRRASGLF